MKNTQTVPQISQGWDGVKQNWPTPPGVDDNEIKGQMPDPNVYAQELDRTLNPQVTDAKTLFDKEHTIENTDSVFDIPLQPMKNFDPKLLESSSPELGRHIKGLLKSTSKTEMKGAFDGRFFRMKSTDAEGNEVNTIYDLKSRKGNKDVGIEISDMFVTSKNGETINTKSLMPKDSAIFYHKKHWLVGFIAPWINSAVASAGSKSLYLFDNYFAQKEYSAITICGHEGQHLKDEQKGLLDRNASLGYFSLRAGLFGLNVITPLLALGITPWALLPTAAINLITYMMARSKDNAIGEGFYQSLKTESNAYYVQGVLEDYLMRKGFMKIRERHPMTYTPSNFQARWVIGYQPLTWSLMDALTAAFAPKKEEKKKTLPVASSPKLSVA